MRRVAALSAAAVLAAVEAAGCGSNGWTAPLKTKDGLPTYYDMSRLEGDMFVQMQDRTTSSIVGDMTCERAGGQMATCRWQDPASGRAGVAVVTISRDGRDYTAKAG